MRCKQCSALISQWLIYYSFENSCLESNIDPKSNFFLYFLSSSLFLFLSIYLYLSFFFLETFNAVKYNFMYFQELLKTSGIMSWFMCVCVFPLLSSYSVSVKFLHLTIRSRLSFSFQSSFFCLLHYNNKIIDFKNISKKNM